MSVAARLNSRITHLAVGRHLPYRTVRARLTLLYGALFLLSGAALMAIAYALLVNAGFVFTLQNGPGNQTITGPSPTLAGVVPPGGFPGPGANTHPSVQTMAHWRTVAQCMRQHGVSRFPDPTPTMPRQVAGLGQGITRHTAKLPNPTALKPSRFSVVSDRDGAILAIPATINLQSATFNQAAATCGFAPDQLQQAAQGDSRRTQVRQQLLIQSGIALAGMSLLSLGLGWLVAGRVLQPLEDSYQAQRQFVANASHELRAPLTRLRALSEVALASSEANVASLRRAHERVLASEEHLEELIDGLLALTRGQAGLERRAHLDLASLTSQAVLAREPDLIAHDLDVHTALDPAPTDGDPRLLERLIANLIDNAIGHNTDGGRVEITTGSRDRHAFLSIANTGPTVPPEQIQRLFQPFERLGAARTGHNNGHGLGLSIVQAIARAHDAELTTLPRPQGGLTVEISFPPATPARSRVTLATARLKRARRRAISKTDAPAGGR